jgi:hypothetical protein
MLLLTAALVVAALFAACARESVFHGLRVAWMRVRGAKMPSHNVAALLSTDASPLLLCSGRELARIVRQGKVSARARPAALDIRAIHARSRHLQVTVAELVEVFIAHLERVNAQ